MPPIMIAVVDIFALLLLFTLFLCHIYPLLAREYFNLSKFMFVNHLTQSSPLKL